MFKKFFIEAYGIYYKNIIHISKIMQISSDSVIF